MTDQAPAKRRSSSERRRRFADRYLILNADVIGLRQAGHDAPVLLGGSTIHLLAAQATATMRSTAVQAGGVRRDA